MPRHSTKKPAPKAPKFAPRDEKGHFQKGYSGNPGGRGKERAKAEMTALARSYGPEALKRLVYWMRSSKEFNSVRASALILERGFGRIPLADEVPQLVLQGEDAETNVTIRFVAPNHPPEDDTGNPRDFPSVLSFEKFTRGA
jgi:hypothetical protein